MPDNSDAKRDSLIPLGIGASAGGIEAAKQFLQAVPEDTGMAVEPDRVYGRRRLVTAMRFLTRPAP